MKDNSLIWVGAGVLLLLLLSKSAGAQPTGDLNLSSLSDDYGSDAVGRLNAIYSELLTRGYSDQQILFMLSQILFETGLFTDQANYPLMNKNNYAGLTNVGDGYASYNSISDFVDAYIGFLTKNNDPLGANSLADFNNRLANNHYYTENTSVYYNGLLGYYNLLNSVLQ